MRWTPRALLPAAVGLFIILSAGVAQALPATTPDNTGMVDFPGAGGLSNAVAVRTIAQSGDNVWVGGRFTEIDDQNGNKVQDAANVAVFNATSGSLQSGVHIPSVTDAGGAPEVYDMSVGPDGNLYFAGNFDHVDGQARNGVAAINATTGALTAFHPSAGNANAVLATASAIYVGTGRLLSFQLNGSNTPGWTDPVAIIDDGIRAHLTLPQFRDLVLQGSTIVAACQCDSLTDAVGTRNVKAVVQINAATGHWVNWAPAGLAANSAGFGINVIVHAAPVTGAPTVYLAAGGSDFTAAFNFATGANPWKTDTSGSSQAITWYQGSIVIGGHYNWSEAPGANGGCGDNDHPNTDCYHTPKLTMLNPATGAVVLDPAHSNKPWNPGICCKYNGVWVLYTGLDGSTLNVGGEFTKSGGTWVDTLPDPTGQNWNLTGASTQQFWARFGGPAATTQPLSLQKTSVAGATGTVTSNPAGISCNAACSGAVADFTTGVNVTLTATPSVGNTFLGWSSSDAGFNCPGTGNCTVTMNQARTVTANFAGVTFPLTITKTGTAPASGSTVASDVTGIDCGATCSAQIPQNTVVTLTATPGANVQFTGWSGAGCAGTGTCVVTMDAAKSVSANFNSTLASIGITKATTTTGQGTVTSNPVGISCSNTCNSQNAPFSVPTVTLSQVPKAADAFAGWTSSDPGFNCPGLGDCTVTMDIPLRSIVAHFDDAKNVKLSTLGTGGGTVTSDPAIMNCTAPLPSGTTCDQGFAENSTVTLIATPDANSIFTGWSSTGSGNTFVSCPGTSTCTFNMGLFQKQVTANFQPAFPLTVHPDGGSGGGTVTSNPPGIDCGLTCGPTNFQTGTNVILTASPDVSNSTFTGWSSADPGFNCPGTGPCTVTMNQARNVTATFTLVQRALAVHVNGHGVVTDTPGPIDCHGPVPDSGTCNGSYEHGTDVHLVPTADLNWMFSGWTSVGDVCTGTDDCVVVMTADHDVTATFARITHSVTVHMAGSGDGTVTSSPDAGIACPGDCAEGFGQGDSESLIQLAAVDSVFTGWSGDCTGTGACNLTIDGAKDVTATFELTHTLTAAVDGGTGTGSVSSDVGGIDCPATTCTSSLLAHNTHVILTAVPEAGSALAGWDYLGCPGRSLTCDVTMDQDHTVTASFELALDLSVTLTGAGTGTVTTPPNNEITCQPTCTYGFAENSSVTLHAAAGAGSIFTGWSSGDPGFNCPGTSDCVVTMDGPRTVEANFEPTWNLNVQRAGSGAGNVTSLTPNLGIDCGVTCDYMFQDGTVVTLHAADGANSSFDSWSGDCVGSGDCVVTMDQARNVTAHYDPIVHQLSITKSGTGTGTVTSDLSGINCGATCDFSFQQGTSVVLHAAPDGTSNFIGWSSLDAGFNCPGTTDCTVSIDIARTVNAQFDLAQRALAVTKAGNGNGSVTSDDAGAIDCPGTCGASYAHGTAVVLTAHVGANSTFTGWSGGICSGTALTCSFNMDAAKSVTATFTLDRHTLTVTKTGGTGTGTVSANVGAINCGATCSDDYDNGTQVTLTPTPDANVVFVTWSGACTGSGACVVTVDAAKSVNATFNLVQHALTVTKAGTGTGQITSNPGTINCPGTCSNNYDHGTPVVLTATPSGGSTFAGWTGGGCSGTGICSVTMNADVAVTGTFNPPVSNITLGNNDPAVAYNGWFGVADAGASGQFYRMSNVTNDSVTFKSTATTSITWVTRTGPDQGKASVTIDGVNKGTVDLYSAALATSNKVYPGLANKVHTIVIKVLGTKNAASGGFNVRLDAFVVGATTTQESDPKIQYDTWKSTAQALATDGTYRSSTNNKATVTVTFTGTAIDWLTTKGKAYGKASVKIDGIAKGTFDMYQVATAWQSLVTFNGLSAGPHTMVIQVLGLKNASATSTKVVVDGFIVHA